MWSYYGRKYKIIDKYPKPIYDTIIEPFAGTASYAYKYWDKNVIISDTYDVIYRIWKYLQQASPKDILSIPDIGRGETIADKHKWLCEEELWLAAFSCNNAAHYPRNVAGRMGFNSLSRDKVRIAKDLYKIKHWTILNQSYETIENQKASYFIDPPYQYAKYRYKNDIKDYCALGNWCKALDGQVIVCENLGADWLSFVPLLELSGQRKRSIEMIWYKE